ncbi:LysR family transcriptional regulator [Derxia gummosa]|uniref:LysR family transcriptional regulator n=1 Tax=Derxia gummosa DSM 723 TaxID=1121388 RepID=A0A8B6X4D9_9BURK|nr:LysR family transcriptional regulator [Derxia gummosa]
MNLKIEDIASFVATVRHASLSRAAEALGLTQPAVTRRIQSLEEALGVQLLDRETKPLKPTVMGWRAYEQCQSLLAEVDSLRSLVETDAVPEGSIRLGVTQAIAELGMTALLDLFRRDFPALRLHICTRWSAELLGLLERGEIDAATVMFPPDQNFPPTVAAQRLLPFEMAVVAAAGSLPKKRGARQLRDIADRGWVLNPDGCGFRARLQRRLADLGLPLDVAFDAFGAELQLKVVAEGGGLGLAPRALVAVSQYRDKVEVVDVADFNPSIDLWLVRSLVPGNLARAIEGFGQSVVAAIEGNLGTVAQAA